MLELDPLDVSSPAQLDHRVHAVPGVVEEERALASDRLELVALRERGGAIEGGEHVAGKPQRAVEDPVRSRRPVPRLAPDPLRLAPEEPRARDVVTADVHQGAALDVGAEADVLLVVEAVREGRPDQPDLADRAVTDELHELGGLRVVAVHERLAQQSAAPLGGVECRIHLLRVAREWLLAEHVLAGLERLDRPLGVQRVRQRDVDRLDLGIGEQVLVRAVGARDLPLAGVRLGPGLVAAGNGDEIDLRRRVRTGDHLPVDVGRGDNPPLNPGTHARTISHVATIGVGMLGYAFMGKAHSNAFRKIAYITWPPPLEPELIGIAGRNEQAVGEAARRFGWEYATTDWRDLVADERIGVFDNGGPNSLHAEPTIAAAQAGKHVVCEKPLGRDADESYEIWSAVAATGVRHMCAFNYRFVPAVRLAREMVEAGELGEVRHFRGRYLQDWGDDPSLDTWRFDPGAAGSGALGDLMTHVVDLARFLNGEIETVSGFAHTFVPGRAVDDAVEAAVGFANGSVGTLEATRFAHGRRNAFQWEINGTKGSLAFDMERLNELQVFRDDGDRARGFKTVLVSEADHPFWQHWWPPGHIVGWGDTFVHELHHFLGAVAGEHGVAPYGADFEDGYRASEVCDAIVRSGEAGQTRDGLVPRAPVGVPYQAAKLLPPPT